MKRFFKVFILVVCLFLVTGCGSEKSSVVKTCKLVSNDVTQGYKLESEYVIYGTGEIVDKVVSTEIVTSDDEQILTYFEQYLKTTYESINQVYGGYDINVKKENGKVVSKTTIDYSKMNLAAYVEANSIMKNYVNEDNKLLVSGLEQTYMTMGAICE